MYISDSNYIKKAMPYNYDNQCDNYIATQICFDFWHVLYFLVSSLMVQLRLRLSLITTVHGQYSRENHSMYQPTAAKPVVYTCGFNRNR